MKVRQWLPATTLGVHAAGAAFAAFAATAPGRARLDERLSMLRSTGTAISKSAFVVGSVAVLLATSAGTAAASDASSAAYYNDRLRAEATYDDRTDNLCVRVVNGPTTARATAAIKPHESGTGLPSREVTAAAGQGWKCTGNMSIPEDKKYELHLRWQALNGDRYAQDYGPLNNIFFT